MKVKIGPYKFKYEKPRNIEVKIDKYDLWNLDHTLAVIIHPALVAYRAGAYGACSVSNEDVPICLRNTTEEDQKYSNDGVLGKKYFKRYEYILDEMIFAFNEILNHDYLSKQDEKRIENGLRLFGKYYRSLWN